MGLLLANTDKYKIQLCISNDGTIYNVHTNRFRFRITRVTPITTTIVCTKVELNTEKHGKWILLKQGHRLGRGFRVVQEPPCKVIETSEDPNTPFSTVCVAGQNE